MEFVEENGIWYLLQNGKKSRVPTEGTEEGERRTEWIRKREQRQLKQKDPFWSKYRARPTQRSKLSSGKPIPGAWRTANREDGW